MTTSTETDLRLPESTCLALIDALIDALNELADWIDKVNIAKGWTEDRTFGDDVALIHSEASEALEAFRTTGDPTARWYTYSVVAGKGEAVVLKDLTRRQVEDLTGHTPEDMRLTGKPEGCGSELADVIIRTLHTGKRNNIDIGAETVEKILYNITRGFRHGGKHL